MTPEQQQAVAKIRNALRAGHRAGLRGGIFEGNFCLWPVDADPDPQESGIRFFEEIEIQGEIIYQHEGQMQLDGGAGL